MLNGDKVFQDGEQRSRHDGLHIWSVFHMFSVLMLLKGATIIQINTDGVMFTGVEQSVVDVVTAEWGTYVQYAA